MRFILPLFILIAVVIPPSTEGAADATASAAGIFWLVFWALVAIGFSFLCSIAEAVLLSVSPAHIATLKEQDKPSAALLQHLKENIDRPLAAILSLNTIAHTVGAAGVGAQAASVWGSQAVGWASGLMTLLILILSEIIPKTIGAVYWRALAPVTARFVQVLIWLLYPLVWISELITRLIAGDKQEIVSREEVAAMAALSLEDGQIVHQESRILQNLFRMRSLTAHDIMTPRPVMVALPQELTVGEALKQHPQLPVSRIPVYEENIDQVVGFVLKSDILLKQADDQPNTPLAEITRDVKVVTADATLIELLDVLLQEHGHLAIVTDEFGGTDGLVTMEDLIETLLGIEIIDEADTAADMQRLAREQWQRRVEALGLEVHPIVPPADDAKE